MFTLIRSQTDISKAQKSLEEKIQQNFTKVVPSRNIGYPGGTKRNCTVYTDGTYWFHSDDAKPKKKNEKPKRLNWFGLYKESHGLNISVEINTAYDGRNNNTAGFFAIHNETNTVYLFHTGRIGGGTKGVSRENLIPWSTRKYLEVIDPIQPNDPIGGFMVMPVTQNDASIFAVRYVSEIARFKQEIRNGLLEKKDFIRKKRRYENFNSEASGLRKGIRTAEILYITRHGDIVNELHKWRESLNINEKEHVTNSQLIDLLVETNGEIIEVYEVKTSAARQYVYGAIGQLMVHGTDQACKRYIVLPTGERIANDLKATFDRLHINVIRYILNPKTVNILDPNS